MGWFKHLSKFMPNTFIKSDLMNDKLDRIASSFDYLPAPRESGEKGFLDPLAVGGATKPDHATTAGQTVNRAFNTGLDSGMANNYDITIPIAITSYTDGLEISFKPVNNNTGASQVKVNGLGYVPLKKANGENLSSGDLSTDSYASFRFNGTEFRSTSLLAGDAYSGMAYMRADVAAQGGIGTDSFSNTVDWNSSDVAKAGCSKYLLPGSNPNGPDSSGKYYHPFTFEFASKDGTGNLTQLAIGYSTNRMFMRYRLSGTWTDWVEFIPSTGGTMTGNLNFESSSGKGIKIGNVSILFETGGMLQLGGSNYEKSLRYKAHWHTFIVDDSSDNAKGFEVFANNNGYFRPLEDNYWYLGTSSKAWKEVNSYAFTTASDERKKNIKDIGDTSWVYDLKPIAYTWKDNPSGLRYGFGAQTTYAIMPDKSANLVRKPDKDEDPWSMQPDQLIPLLLNEMKVLRKRIEKLEGK